MSASAEWRRGGGRRRLFYIPSWRLSLPPRPLKSPKSKVQAECWLIFVDRDGIGCQVAQRLEQNNQHVVSVQAGERFHRQNDRAFTLNPHHYDDYQTLLKELRALGKPPDKIMHFWSITPDDHRSSGIEFFQQAQDAGYYSLLFLCHALEKAGVTTPVGMTVVSNHLHRVVDGEIAYPEKMT